MDPFQCNFEDDEYALHEMIQAGTEAAGCFQEIQNEDDGSQYLNDPGDDDADTIEEMHVEDDIPEVTYIHIYNFKLPDRRARNVNESRRKRWRAIRRSPCCTQMGNPSLPRGLRRLW